MSERDLGEVPARPEIQAAKSTVEQRPYYPSVHLDKKKLGDLFGKISVGDTLEAEFVVKCVSKSENEEGGGHICLELLSIEIDVEEEEAPKDMIAAVKAAAKKLEEAL
jgi:hypothetical protein